MGQRNTEKTWIGSRENLKTMGNNSKQRYNKKGNKICRNGLV